MSEHKINDGGSAFPLPYDFIHDHPLADGGMSLRDYFAAKAMQQLIELHPTHIWNEGMDSEEPMISYAKHTARAAYVMADAMLEQRDSQ
jgi:hypothetical protein